MVDNVFILAGGSGNRLWPASSKQNPKQFLKILEDKSLLQLTIERALSLGVKGSIYIITLKNQIESIAVECGNISRGKKKIKIIAEPSAKNTAPAITLVSKYLETIGEGESTVIVLPADHIVSPIGAFVEDVLAADNLAIMNYLVTFGIKPDRAETGYGYIEIGEKKSKGFIVKSFKEKPDLNTAEAYLKKGGFFWNSGMFAFKINVFLSELHSYCPAIASLFTKENTELVVTDRNGIDVIQGTENLEKIYQKASKISVDYAVMEKSGKASMVEASFEWNDIGSWDEMSRLELVQDKMVIHKNSENNFIFSDLPVALCGVNDLIVVIKEGKALICKKGQSQKVKEIAEESEKNF